MTDWDADGDGDPSLKTWQIMLDASGFNNGVGCDLQWRNREPCADHAECEEKFGPWSRCNPSLDGFCRTIGFDDARTDWVFEPERWDSCWDGNGWLCSHGAPWPEPPRILWSAAILGDCVVDGPNTGLLHCDDGTPANNGYGGSFGLMYRW